MPRRVPFFRPPGQADASKCYARTESRRKDNSFYSSAPWRKLRAAFLASNPLCVDCLKQGRTTAAEHVHHVQERKLRPDLALDWDNLEALCEPCHGTRRRSH